jgi:hypothetical protein
VPGIAGATAEDLSRIAREFPGWRPWMSDAGRWWATRRGVRLADPPEWWAVTVDADDADGLRAVLGQQERLASAAGAA